MIINTQHFTEKVPASSSDSDIDIRFINGVPIDFSNNALTITPSSDLAVADDRYGQEKAVEFDGVDQRAYFPSITLDKDNSAFRVRFKLNSVNPANKNSYNMILNSGSFFYRMLSITTPASGFNYFSGRTNNIDEKFIETNSFDLENIWLDLCCIFDNGICYSFLNNKLIDTKSVNYDLTLYGLNGVTDGVSGTFSNITMDRFQIWTNTISLTLNKALYKEYEGIDKLYLATEGGTTGITINSSVATTIDHGDTSTKEIFVNNVELSHTYPTVTENWLIVINNVSNLIDIYCEDCNLVGNFPSILMTSINIKTISFSGNSLGGFIPAEIQNLAVLETINLASNSIESIPTELAFITSLISLNFFDNELESLPSNLGLLPNLNLLNFSSNNISSTVLDAFVVDCYNNRSNLGENSCDIQIQNNAGGISLDNVARIEGTGLYAYDISDVDELTNTIKFFGDKTLDLPIGSTFSLTRSFETNEFFTVQSISFDGTKTTLVTNEAFSGITPTIIGDELTTNGGFDTDSSRTYQPTWEISGGVLKSVNNGVNIIAYQYNTMETGKTYKVKFEMLNYVSGILELYSLPFSTGNIYASNGNYEFIINGNGANYITFKTRASDCEYQIDNVSIMEVDTSGDYVNNSLKGRGCSVSYTAA